MPSTLEIMDRSRHSIGISQAPSARTRVVRNLALVFLSAAFAVPALSQPAVPPGTGDANEEVGTGLELVNLDLLDSRDGYAIPADSEFLPGERIHIYGQIKGYQVGDADRVRLRYRATALDPDGNRFYTPVSGGYDTELAPQDKDWMPIVRYSPRIPDHAGGGTYVVRFTVHDLLADQTAEAEVPILVDAERVERAEELLVRNFAFSRSEHGDPLRAPEFRAGEQVWASFYITGYETRENNTFDVTSDAWVLDSDGEELFAFKSSEEEGRPFYPRLWLPASLHLNLDDTIPPGQYTVVLRLHDRVAGAESTQRYGFRIR